MALKCLKTKPLRAERIPIYSVIHSSLVSEVSKLTQKLFFQQQTKVPFSIKKGGLSGYYSQKKHCSPDQFDLLKNQGQELVVPLMVMMICEKR